MRFLYFIFIELLILVFASCNKKKVSYSQKQNIENITKLKNYTIVSKTKKNDSIDYIVGENKSFTISGNFNNKENKKTDWWIVKEKNTSKSLKIEYIIFDNKLFKNQIIYLDKNRIDTLASKFYSIKENRKNNNLQLFFHSPRNNSENLYKCKVQYFMFVKNKIIGSDSIIWTDSNGKYFASISLNKFPKANFMKGAFTEYTTSKLGKDSMNLGVNSIYFFSDFGERKSK